MSPCLWRFFEVMTIKTYRQLFIEQCRKCTPYIIKSRLFLLCHTTLSDIYPHRVQCSLGSCSAETLLVLAVPKRKAREQDEIEKKRMCPWIMCINRQSLNKCEFLYILLLIIICSTCLTLFIRLYFFRSSSLAIIWCRPLPISLPQDKEYVSKTCLNQKGMENGKMIKRTRLGTTLQCTFLPEYPKDMLEIGLK